MSFGLPAGVPRAPCRGITCCVCFADIFTTRAGVFCLDERGALRRAPGPYNTPLPLPARSSGASVFFLSCTGSSISPVSANKCGEIAVGFSGSHRSRKPKRGYYGIERMLPPFRRMRNNAFLSVLRLLLNAHFRTAPLPAASDLRWTRSRRLDLVVDEHVPHAVCTDAVCSHVLC